MPVVVAKEVSRAFDNRRVLTDVSMSIHRGERVGLVGINGSGKSTLGRILAGVDAPDSGEVSRRRAARIAYLDQHPVLPSGTSALEVALSGLEDWCRARARYDALTAEIAAGTAGGARLEAQIAAQAAATEQLEHHGGWDLVHRAEAILGHLEIADPAAEVGRLSGGEQRRVALARVLIAQPDLAVLDEPTNHLDLATIDWLETFLIEEYRGALLLITHDRYILDRVATRTVELSDGQAYSYDGGYERYLAARAERTAQQEREERNRQNYLRVELEWLRRQPKARTSKSQARIDRIETAVEAVPLRAAQQVELGVAAARSGKTVLELHDLRIELAGRTLVESLTLHLGAGERIGIVGPNGCGKTTLLRCLVGELPLTSGRIVRGSNAKIGYLDQVRSGLDDEATVFDNIMGELGSVRIGERDLGPRAYLERFLFDPTMQRTRVGALSGGERARVSLAKLLAAPVNLMILDEPTNDLDVATLSALELLLLELGGAALVVTHDRYFLDRIATSLLVFEGDGRVIRHHGSYSAYLANQPRPTAKLEAVAVAPAVAVRSPRSAKLTYAEERERESLPDRIETIEQQLGSCERELADPAIYVSRGAEVPGLVARVAELKAEVERLIERWEELETRSLR